MKSFSLKERVRFMKKLAFLLESGIPFLTSLHFMEEREERKKMKKHLEHIILRVQSGSPIHKSLDTRPHLVDEQSLRLIENGEMTGTLGKGCGRIAEDLQVRLTNRNRLFSALTYPAFILAFALVLVITLVVFVFPKILSILDSGSAPLPLPTRMLIATSEFLKEKGLIAVALLCGLGTCFATLFKHSLFFKKTCQKLFLALPISSHVLKLLSALLFSKLLSLFLESGYTLSESLYHAERLEKNLVFKKAYAAITSGVQSGDRFSRLLAKERLFPKELAQFAALGEESGNLAKILFQVSSLFEEELREIEKRMFSLLEPALMLFLGLVVGFVAMSLISPIYSLTSSLSQTAP